MYKSPVTESQGFGTLILRRCLPGIDVRNQILAGLASIVTTSLIPFNDIKIISAPLDAQVYAPDSGRINRQNWWERNLTAKELGSTPSRCTITST